MVLFGWGWAVSDTVCLQEISYLHMSDALVGIPIKLIFRDYEFGVVVSYGKQIPKLPVDRLLSVQPERHLDIEPFVISFANKINFEAMEGSHLDIIAHVEQLVVYNVLQKLAPVL